MENYNFKWEDIGDIELGRPNLGQLTNVSVYRLMQYTLKDVLENEYGIKQAKKLFVDAGRLAGTEFCKNVLDVNLPLNEFISQLHDKLIELSIGILKIEKSDMDKMSFVLTVSEDIDCSGLPITGKTVCDYDEGFIEGIFNIYTGKKFFVKEVDCWSTGERTCRFTVDLKK
jgi:uncharacterized protein